MRVAADRKGFVGETGWRQLIVADEKPTWRGLIRLDECIGDDALIEIAATWLLS